MVDIQDAELAGFYHQAGGVDAHAVVAVRKEFLNQFCLALLLAYHNILILTSFQSYYEFGTEVKTDFPDAINVGDILSIETEEKGQSV